MISQVILVTVICSIALVMRERLSRQLRLRPARMAAVRSTRLQKAAELRAYEKLAAIEWAARGHTVY